MHLRKRLPKRMRMRSQWWWKRTGSRMLRPSAPAESDDSTAVVAYFVCWGAIAIVSPLVVSMVRLVGDVFASCAGIPLWDSITIIGNQPR